MAAALRATLHSIRPPHARDNAPWCDCGPVGHPDFGTIFARPSAMGGFTLTFDRDGNRFAGTTKTAPGAQTVLHNRTFDVVRLPGFGPEAA